MKLLLACLIVQSFDDLIIHSTDQGKTFELNQCHQLNSKECDEVINLLLELSDEDRNFIVEALNGVVKPNYTSNIDDCIEDLRILSTNPIDKKLLKQELLDKYSDYTIKLARKIIREREK